MFFCVNTMNAASCNENAAENTYKQQIKYAVSPLWMANIFAQINKLSINSFERGALFQTPPPRSLATSGVPPVRAGM